MNFQVHHYADVLEDLQALVTERGPDFVYRAPVLDNGAQGPDLPYCRYEYNGVPSCGLGKVFADRWAVPIESLSRLDREQDTEFQLRRFGHKLTPAARRLLFAFQGRQDKGLPYGEALTAAIDLVSAHH